MTHMHKDYDKTEFAYDKISKAWIAINGVNSVGNYFFVGHLQNPKLLNSLGEWMAYNVRTQEKESLIIPFDYAGFHEEGDAEEAIFDRVYKKLGWRINEMGLTNLPWEKADSKESLENKL